MYLPEHFQESDPARLHDAMEAWPLGTLVTAGPGGLDADHLPFELDRGQGPRGTLRCHVARSNPVWRAALASGMPALVIFRGPSGYVSPNWYPEKAATHRAVPTYNYAVVHAHGRIVVHDDEKWVRGVVARLTRRHEAGGPAPWRMTDAPADFIDDQLARIVGLEIRIDRLEGKWKMSQNRPPADRVGVAEGLRAQGDAASRELAGEVERASPPAVRS